MVYSPVPTTILYQALFSCESAEPAGLGHIYLSKPLYIEDQYPSITVRRCYKDGISIAPSASYCQMCLYCVYRGEYDTANLIVSP